MPYLLTNGSAKAVAKDIIKAELIRPQHQNRGWTAQSLKYHLADIGLSWPVPLLQTILDEMVTEGTLRVVP